jgi:2,4-dichlorophenol 6-monooxygenase
MGKLRVAIVGAGPTGLMAAILLRTRGVDVTIYDQTDTRLKLPKAHIVNARAGELFREIGIMEDVEKLSAPAEKCQYVIWSESVAGVQYGAQWYGVVANDFTPSRMMNIGQDRLEEVFSSRARALGVNPLLNYKITSVAKVEKRAELTIVTPGGAEKREVFDYVLACDGASSTVRRQLGIEMDGPPSLARFINCYFKADLGRFFGEKPGPVRFITGLDVSGAIIGYDLETTWNFGLVYPEGFTPEDYTTEVMREFIARAIGDRSVAFEIIGRTHWNMSAQIARQFRDGPFFLLGDAAHRMPPSGGLGLNTGIQDAHNLAWKLAWVDRGLAGDGLLDTFESERKPVSERNNEYSMQNAFGMAPIDAAIGARSITPIPPTLASEPLRGVSELGLAPDSPGREERLAAIRAAVLEFEHKYDIHNIAKMVPSLRRRSARRRGIRRAPNREGSCRTYGLTSPVAFPCKT